MRPNRHATIVLSALLVVACGGSEPPQVDDSTASATVTSNAPLPSPAEAAELITASQPFGDYHFTYSSWTFPLDRPVTHETQLVLARELEKGGWLTVEDGRIALTDKGRSDKRFLERPNGSLDIVPLAKKEIIEVSAIERSDDGARALVRWRWVPNEVGEAFTAGSIRERFASEHLATVTLTESSQGAWEVWSVTEASGS